jgi:hypothetical protein
VARAFDAALWGHSAASHSRSAAVIGGWQRYHQGADHRVVLLGILVREEELIRLVDQQRVQIDGQLGPVRKPKLILYRRQDVGQRSVVPHGADEALRNLPGVADVRVGQRLLAPPKPSRLAELDELAHLRGCQREPDAPEPLDVQAHRLLTFLRHAWERLETVSAKL